MRPRQRTRLRRTVAHVLLLAAFLLTALPQPALAADQLIPHNGSGEDAPLIQQTGPASPGPSSIQLIPSTQFVEDPTRQAGGEDDAQRANERATERSNDDGEPRRR